MKWFKFYGQDWLTDLKIMKMSVEDRLCFITLLCLASSEENAGTIKNCDEEAVIELTHLYQDPYEDTNEYTRTKGFLGRLVDNKMITIDNAGNVIIVNFMKRQAQNLTGYERVKKYREKKKDSKIKVKSGEKYVINDNASDNANDNARIDKNRIDKNRIDILSSSKTMKDGDSGFYQFWESYPRKIGKVSAIKAWQRIKANPEEVVKILDAIKVHKDSEQWQRDGGRFIPHPATFLNQRRFDDEVPKVEKPKIHIFK